MNISKALRNAGHQALLPIQKESIDTFESYSDLIILAGTGSGKTLAFLLASLQKVDKNQDTTQLLILAPTRELAVQIHAVLKSLKSDVTSSVCYGGHSMKDERNSLSNSPNVIIGTPGRILDHIERNHLDTTRIKTIIIDEFDKCLELGFEYEMKEIVLSLSSRQNTILASATNIKEMPAFIPMRNAQTLDYLSSSKPSKLKEYFINYSEDIFETLTSALNAFNNEKTIVFCNYREVVDDIVDRLDHEGIISTTYHGGLEQAERERALIKFRNGSSNILVCTDLGARGLDIPEVKHIIHYQYPGSEAAFTHRKGRTARMSADGASYIFVGPDTTLPEYVSMPKNEYSPKPAPLTIPQWKTVYISAGKKDKINKIDIVGFLYKKGGLKKHELGIIDVLDRSSYAAIDARVFKKALHRIRKEKIKGKRLKIQESM